MRVSVVGTSGSGKTTVARSIADRLDVPFLELDSIRHQPGWEPLPDADMRALVADFVAGDAWVVDGNYSSVVQDLVWARATHVVWVDPPRWRVMVQVVWRSVLRAVTRQELWNGNRERWRSWLEPDHPIRWAWATFDRRRSEYAQARDHRWVRLSSRRDVRAWLAAIG